MRTRASRLFAVLLIALSTSTCRRPNGVDDERLRRADADTASWLMYGRTYDDHRFSPLTQINEQTIGKARVGVDAASSGRTRGLEATPLVEDGVIYTTSAWSVVYALDAKTGDVRWTYDPKVPRSKAFFICCDVVNRGVALYHGKVYVGTLDGRLIALDQQTGRPVWSVMTVDIGQAYAISGAPRIAKGMVMIGNAVAEYGVRGYISAYDAETGAQRWRTYTVPGDPANGFESKAMENAAATWDGEWWKAGGGGTAWEGIVYDPALDLLYFGTGNATAWYRALRTARTKTTSTRRRFLRCTRTTDRWRGISRRRLAITGTTTRRSRCAGRPDDRRPPAQGDHAGEQERLLLCAGSSDRRVHFRHAVCRVASPGPQVSIQRPAARIETSSGVRGTQAGDRLARIRAARTTGIRWRSVQRAGSSTSAYEATPPSSTRRIGCGGTTRTTPTREWGTMKDPCSSNYSRLPPPTGELVAWDPVKQQAAWRVTLPSLESGGTLATAGNLVFHGRGDGTFAAYRASDGKQLWQFDAGTGIIGSPVSYVVDGTQYVTVLAGWGGAAGLLNFPWAGKVKPGYGRILTFALGATGSFVAKPFGHAEPPRPAITLNVSPNVVHEGAGLYNANCMGCHGFNVVAGPIPDLRYASKDVHDQFEQIVLGGQREMLGMPSFKKILNADQVRAIQAYVLSRAAESAKAAEASTGPK